tara:strand:- start:328 stop:516 length:189 start_codon:yes stop_codon:yes gene_type:complete
VAKYTIYAKRVYYYRKDINAQDMKSAEKRGADYEAEDNPERLFEPSGTEFYITSTEESEDEL